MFSVGSSCENVCESRLRVTDNNLRITVNSYLAGNDDMNCLDTSAVTEMSSLFSGKKSFNGNISCWDVTSVTSMMVSTIFSECVCNTNAYNQLIVFIVL